MSSADQILPEGTDHVIEGAGVSSDDDATFDTNPGSSVANVFADNGARSTPSAGGTGNSGGDGRGASEKPASAGSSDDNGPRASASEALFGRFDDLKGQAGDRARDLAQAGKDRATAALDDLVRMIEDAAGEVDGKLGAQYGDYARRAAYGIGDFSDSFKNKDVDQLFVDARELVKKSPTVAVGVAAALGFVVARIVRAGVPDATAPAAKPGQASPEA